MAEIVVPIKIMDMPEFKAFMAEVEKRISELEQERDLRGPWCAPFHNPRPGNCCGVWSPGLRCPRECSCCSSPCR
jgi:hypothetical protein